MKIYLDLIIIINFIIDLLLLYGTKKILKRKTSIKRILIGAIIGSISSLLIIYTNNIILKVLISIFIIIITFGINNLFTNTTYFYILSIILGGTLYLFDINIYKLNYQILILFSPLFIYLYIKENIKYKNIHSNNYIVEIYINNKMYKLEGMIDTGNELKDPYKKRSIILVNLSIDYTKYKYLFVPYKALNTEGIIPCIKPDRIIINNKIFTNYLIGLSKDKFHLNGVECILPNTLKEELWEKY